MTSQWKLAVSISFVVLFIIVSILSIRVNQLNNEIQNKLDGALHLEKQTVDLLASVQVEYQRVIKLSEQIQKEWIELQDKKGNEFAK